MPKRVSLNALRVLATVAQTRSFKLAAARLGVTQSAISRQIQSLEAQLGARLIQRDNRVHDLTPTGSLLAPELQRIFLQLDELISNVSENTAADHRVLTVAVADSVLSHFLAPHLDRFYALYPHLQLQFKNCAEYLSDDLDLNEQIQQRLVQDEWDIVISCGDIASKQIESLIITPLRYQTLTRTSDQTNASADAVAPQPPHAYSVTPSDDKLSMYRDGQQSSNVSITPVDTSSAALALSVGQGGDVHVPTFMLKHVMQQLPLEPRNELRPQRSKLNLYLRCFYPRHKQRELSIVAFSNWLAHIGAEL